MSADTVLRYLICSENEVGIASYLALDSGGYPYPNNSPLRETHTPEVGKREYLSLLNSIINRELVEMYGGTFCLPTLLRRFGNINNARTQDYLTISLVSISVDGPKVESEIIGSFAVHIEEPIGCRNPMAVKMELVSCTGFGSELLNKKKVEFKLTREEYRKLQNEVKASGNIDVLGHLADTFNVPEEIVDELKPLDDLAAMGYISSYLVDWES